MQLNERSIANYIEIELNKDRPLSEIKEDLYNLNIPPIIIKQALKYAFTDEQKYLHKLHEQPTKKHHSANQLWWIYVLIILGIISGSVAYLLHYLRVF